MKNKISIFSYTSYRSFIADWLKENEFSYRSFVERYPKVVSLIALAKLLSRGRFKDKERGDYRMAPEALARLGKTIRLSDAELRHLILLRLENDSGRLPGQYGASYQQVMQELVEENRLQAIEGIRKQAGAKAVAPGGQAGGTQTAALLSEIIDIFPQRFRLKVVDEILEYGEIVASRQSRRVGVRPLQNLLQELRRLRDMGVP